MSGSVTRRRLLGRLPPSAVSLGLTIGSRGVAVAGGIALSLLLARETGADGLGVFTYVQSWMVILAIVIRWGTDQSLVRKVATLNERGEGARAFYFASMSLGSGATLAVLIVALAFLFDGSALLGRDVEPVVRIQMLSLPALVMANVAAGFLKGQRLSATAAIVEIGAIYGLTALAAIAFEWGGGADLTLLSISRVYVLICWIVALGLLVAIAGMAMWRHGSLRVLSAGGASQPKDGFRAFYHEGWVFMLLAISAFATQSGAFGLAGGSLEDAQLGHLRAAERLALPISFALLGINPFLMPRIAAAFARGGLAAVMPIYRKAVLASAAFALPIGLACLIFGRQLLSLFGPGFETAYPFLVVMVLAQLGHAIVGVSNLLLIMTRYERLALSYSVAALLLALILFPWLSRNFGPMGFCVAYLVILLLKDLGYLLSVRILARR